MSNDINALVRRMSRIAEEAFNEEGEVPHIWLVDTVDEQKLIITSIPGPEGADEYKQKLADKMREMFRENGVWRYALAMEIWMTADDDGPRPSLHPRREEAVMVYAEDGSRSVITMRKIVRSNGGAYLEKLGAIEDFEGRGRFQNLLSKRTVQ